MLLESSEHTQSSPFHPTVFTHTEEIFWDLLHLKLFDITDRTQEVCGGSTCTHQSRFTSCSCVSLLSLANPLVFLHLCVFNTNSVYLFKRSKLSSIFKFHVSPLISGLTRNNMRNLWGKTSVCGYLNAWSSLVHDNFQFVPEHWQTFLLVLISVGPGPKWKAPSFSLWDGKNTSLEVIPHPIPCNWLGWVPSKPFPAELLSGSAWSTSGVSQIPSGHSWRNSGEFSTSLHQRKVLP